MNNKQLNKGNNTMNGMYQRDHKEAFENAKLKGLNNPGEYTLEITSTLNNRNS